MLVVCAQRRANRDFAPAFQNKPVTIHRNRISRQRTDIAPSAIAAVRNSMPRANNVQRPTQGVPVSKLVWPTAVLCAGMLLTDFAVLVAGSVHGSWLITLTALGAAVTIALFAILGCAL